MRYCKHAIRRICTADLVVGLVLAAVLAQSYYWAYQLCQLSTGLALLVQGALALHAKGMLVVGGWVG